MVLVTGKVGGNFGGWFFYLNQLESLTFYSKLMINETIIDECGSESKKTRRIL